MVGERLTQPLNRDRGSCLGSIAGPVTSSLSGYLCTAGVLDVTHMREAETH